MVSLTHTQPVATASAPARYLAMRRSDSDIAALDGLRAAAILLVFARHAVRPFESDSGALLPLFGWDLAVALSNGWIGVDLFFVLSGFLIGRSLLRQREKGRPMRFGLYLAKRALRIVPAYLAVLLIAAAGLVPLFEVAPQALWLRVGYHLLFLQDYLPSNILVVFWSLGVEEKFYLMAPLAVAAVLALPWRGLQYAAVACLALLGPLGRFLTALAHPEIADYEAFFPVFRSPFHLCLDPLFIGLLASLIYRDRQCWAWTSSKARLDALFLLGLAVILWLALPASLLREISFFDKTLQPVVIAGGYGLMLLAAALGGGPCRLLQSVPLLVLSRLSYPLYLVHLALLPLALACSAALGADDPGTGAGAMLVFIVCYAAISLAGALVLHYGIEKPFLLIKNGLR